LSLCLCSGLCCLIKQILLSITDYSFDLLAIASVEEVNEHIVLLSPAILRLV
jgi:hypothetical protein